MMGKITRCITSDGNIVMTAADTTDIVARAEKIHETSAVTTAALGRLMTACSLAGQALKGENDTVSFQIKADGPAGSLVTVSDSGGNVRGYVENPIVELPLNNLGKLDVGSAVGKNGYLTVIKDLGLKEPYVGSVELVSGEIAEDVTEYYASSEQTPTVCALGVLTNKDTTPRAAGGFLLQLLPYADETIIPTLEKNIASLPPISSMINDGLGGEDVIAKVLDGIEYDVFDNFDIDYICPCTRETYIKGLMSLGKAELERLCNAEEKIETRCMYCGATHTFSKEEIAQMIEAIPEK